MSIVSLFYRRAIEQGHAEAEPFTYRTARALFNGTGRQVRVNLAVRRTPKHNGSRSEGTTTLAKSEDPSRPDPWYAPRDGDAGRFIGADGMPCLRLIPYRDSARENLLRLCEDTTGLLVGPTEPRLTTAGVLVSQLRGEAYNEAACRAGDFRPGARVRLVPEPDNQYDDRAVAVYAENGRAVAAYMNKQKARLYLKRTATGETLEAISTGCGSSGVT